LELLSRMPTLSWGVQWSACLAWPPSRDVGSLAPAPLLYEGLLPGVSCVHALFISGHPVEYLSIWSSVVRLSSCGSSCYTEGFFLEPLCTCPLYLGASSGVPVYLASIVRLQFLQFLPLLHRGLLLGAPCMHAHFISGRPVEYLSVWSSIVRLSSCGSCLLLYRGLSSWSLFCTCPLHLGVSSGVPICLASVVQLLSCHFILGVFLGYHRIDSPFICVSVCRSFLLDVFLQVLLPLVLPSSPAFLRIRFILCQFLFGTYFCRALLIRSDLQKAVRIVSP